MQPLVRARVAELGAPGRRWADGLPATLADLACDWRLELGRPLPGGSASYVVAARSRDDDSALVLKVAMPDVSLAPQARILAAAGGNGYVHLHGYDTERDALLLEALGPSLDPRPAPGRRAAAGGGRHARCRVEAARRSRSGTGSVSRGEAAGAARWVGRPGRLRSASASPGPGVRRRAHRHPRPGAARDGPRRPPPRQRVARGCTRPGAESGYVLVDPDGIRTEPEHDLGVAVRDWSRRVLEAEDPGSLVDGWCRLLGERTGLDAERIGRWAFLERVTTGLYVCSFGAERVGRTYLDSAARLVRTV